MASSSNKNFRPKSLSRNSLYAPLDSYFKTSQNYDETTTTTNSSSFITSRKFREKNLYNFLETISSEYHSPTSIVLNSPLSSTPASTSFSHHGNTSRSINAFQYENYLAQRALTLIGGGIGTSLASTTTSSAPNDDLLVGQRSSRATQKKGKRKSQNYRIHGSISNKERKRRLLMASSSVTGSATTTEETNAAKKSRTDSNEIMETSQPNITRDSQSDDNNDGVGNHLQYNHHSTMYIYMQLHKMWRSYITTLLKGKHISPTSQEKRPQSDDSIQIANLMSNAEHVGAFATIQNCKSHSSYVGKSGIVVEVTVNTWKVALVPKGNTWGTLKDACENSCTSGSATGKGVKSAVIKGIHNKVWKVVIVPKRGSTLIMPIPVKDNRQNDMERNIAVSG